MMDYRSIIESKYNRQNWQALLHDIFGSRIKFWNTPSAVSINSQFAKQALWLGTITLSDEQTISVYEVELSDSVDIERNRRGIRDMLLTTWRNNGNAGAFMFCYRKNESVLRFSYVSETWAFNKEGAYEKVSTDTKRYTYLLGENRGCRTAIDQFTSLKDSKQTLSDITAAFSVEALTKQFYKDLFEWYQWAIEPSSNVTFPNNIAIEDDDRDDIEKKMIRLITRIMFVWFIKQKDLVPHKIFDTDFLSTILKDFNPYSKTNGNYYNAILQNLFFATLNRAIIDEDGSKRRFATASKKDIKTLYRYSELFSISEEDVINLFAEVPFLNGGLFECLDKTKTIDGVEQAFNFDGFSRNDAKFADGRYRNRAVVPNNLFFEPEKGLISILNRYNFTIEENSPEEQQVALDPELLGKVFENLLGAYNPETKETARNQSGSFYTPREIVNYMVDESLIAYIGDTPLVRSLFKSDFVVDDNKKEDYAKIATKLKAVKVLDPACGSGAFPMGLLNRMIDILQKISPNENVYDLKLSIIENCIYGSDIQSIATQISKLRFFISLICDCEKDAAKVNFGIPTLPNLETKFVAANSLINLTKERGQLQLVSFDVEEKKEELKEIRHQHFHATTAGAKIRLRKRDEEVRKELKEMLERDNMFSSDEARLLAEWNPYDQNAVASFFDPQWMLGVEDKFDIVIGNPPYIQLQNNGGELAKLYEKCGYKTFARTGDIYCLFYERGWQLLKHGGHLCFITSNKWMRAGYGEKTREFFATKTNPMLLIDFAGVKIFESATVDTNILLFAKSDNKHETICAVTNKQNANSIKNLSDFVQQQYSVCGFVSSDSWVILSPIEQSIKRKIEAVGTPLKDWDINIYRGVLTGYNDAFIINTEKRNEILENCQTEEERKNTAELIRPILRGRDIKRYGYVDNGLYLINTHNGVKGKFPRIDINDYPAVKAHLDQYWDKISVRADKGDTPYNLRNCAYLEDFSKPKIIYPETTSGAFFAFDDKGLYLDKTCFMLISDDAEYLQLTLSSKLFEFAYRKIFSSVSLGEHGYQYNKHALIKLPIIRAHKVLLKRESLDSQIYSLYKISQEEINFIESLQNQ